LVDKVVDEVTDQRQTRRKLAEARGGPGARGNIPR
jgi:hypothetical protein